MSYTSPSKLIGLGIFIAVAAYILTHRFYGVMPPIPPSVAITLWGAAAICGFGLWTVRRNIAKGRVGLDRTQLNPLAAANWLAYAKASAYTGAIVGGAYAGIAAYVLPSATRLDAAAGDTPGVIVCTLGAVTLAVLGVLLERSCAVPPGGDADPA